MIQGSGIISGLDTRGLISQLMQIERQPLRRLQQRQTAIGAEISALGSLSSAMSELKSALEALSDRAGVLAFGGTSSNDAVATVTADGTASESRFELTVSQLARAEKQRSAAFASPLGEVTAGTLEITVFGEDTVTVEIAEGDTLTDVRDAINASGAAVSATIIYTGNQAYLSLTATKSGHEVGGLAADALVITESYTGGSGQTLQLAETQTARNALFEVDGIAVEQSSNQVTGVVEGLTFSLLATTSDPVTLTVAPDPAGVTEKLSAFVDAYNKVIEVLSSQEFAGSGTLRLVKGRFEEILSGLVAGVSGPYQTLASIGVALDYSTGRLGLDETQLSAALAADAGAVARLFTTADTGLVATLVPLLESYTNSTGGVLKLTQDSLNAKSDALDRQIDLRERQLSKRQEALQRQFSALETLIAGLQTSQAAFMGILGAGS